MTYLTKRITNESIFIEGCRENTGVAGEIIKATEGFARNYLIPQKFAVEVTAKNNII